MTFEVNGLEEFLDQIEEFKEQIDEANRKLPEQLDAAVEESAKELKGQIIILAPEDTGKLKRSVGWHQVESAQSGRRSTYSVGPTVEYAPYVEFGTGKYGPKGQSYTITPDGVSEEQAKQWREQAREGEKPQEMLDAPKLSFEVDGETVTTTMVEHPGYPGKRFFRDAVAIHEEQERLTESIEKHTADLFEGEMQ